LKLRGNGDATNHFHRFQPTYEGLKLALVMALDRAMRQFPAYLRGIETRESGAILSSNIPFPAYLRGIETAAGKAKAGEVNVFPAYLRGIETGRGRLKSQRKSSFQPTYEGLKLFTSPEDLRKRIVFPAYLRGIETWKASAGIPTRARVSSLPTRD